MSCRGIFEKLHQMEPAHGRGEGEKLKQDVFDKLIREEVKQMTHKERMKLVLWICKVTVDEIEKVESPST